MRVGADDHGAGCHVPSLDHHLVTDARAGRIEVDAVFACELLDAGVLPEILGGEVLDVVINGIDRLRRIMDLLGADGLELLHDGRRVVVRHDVLWMDAYEITRVDRASPAVHGGDLFNERLWHGSYFVLRGARDRLESTMMVTRSIRCERHSSTSSMSS